MASSIQDLAAHLLASPRIVTATHCAPDGDGLGCELALLHALEPAGKSLTLLADEPVPPRFCFLPASERVLDWNSLSTERRAEIFAGDPSVLIVDTHEWSLLGDLGDFLRGHRARVRFLDHHPITRPDDPAITCDPGASSAGEMCWRLFAAMRARLNEAAATCLYAAIAYDTNMFKYLRRRAETHRIAAELMDLGAETDRIYRCAFASNPPAKLILLGEILRDVRFEETGRIAWTTVTREQLSRTRIRRDDLRDLIVPLLEISDVEIALLFKERADGHCKVSLRSKGNIPVDRIAIRLGGGGHAFAAGAQVSGPWQDAISRALALTREAFQAAQNRD